MDHSTMFFLRRPVLSFFRLHSLFSKSEVDSAKSWLETFQHLKIPRDLFSISYSRSSGPGGQKVNKTSSKATVSLEPHQWMNPQFCYWIPKPILDQISLKKLRYETKNGGLLIQSDLSRNRDNNTDECFRKLLQEIKDNVFFEAEVSEEDKKKWVKLTEELKERRLNDKKRQSDKKKMRSKKFDI